jgi:endonuclease-3
MAELAGSDQFQRHPEALADCLARLARLYPGAPTITDPLALIVWENVGYLIPDERRQSLFEELRERVGLDAARLAHAPQEILMGIAQKGGMRPAERADRLRDVGRLALEAGGDLAAALRIATPSRARALLKRFPGIGDPGADKILLFSGVEIRPALESNGVRALVRLGYAAEGASYAQAYRGAVAALNGLGPPHRDRLVEAFLVLRAHGQTLCKRGAPLCLSCPLDPVCAHITTKTL